MKLTIKAIIATALISASPAVAQGQNNCATIGEMAYSIMQGRQNGVPMSGYMDAISNTPDIDPFLAEFMGAVVLDAYDESRFINELDKIDAAEEFRNAIEALCYQAL